MANKASDFDIAAFDAADTADLNVRNPVTGEPTGWVITFAGPGHPQSVVLSEKLARQRLRRAADQERAQVNGRKWKPDVQDPDEALRENLENVVAQIVTWTPARIDGKVVEFSPKAALELLSNPRRGWLMAQIAEFLAGEQIFTPSSAKTS